MSGDDEKNPSFFGVKEKIKDKNKKSTYIAFEKLEINVKMRA